MMVQLDLLPLCTGLVHEPQDRVDRVRLVDVVFAQVLDLQATYLLVLLQQSEVHCLTEHLLLKLVLCNSHINVCEETHNRGDDHEAHQRVIAASKPAAAVIVRTWCPGVSSVRVYVVILQLLQDSTGV